MRTKYCTLIGRAVCVDVDLVILDLTRDMVGIERTDGSKTVIYPPGMDEFARADGFEDWPAMRQFWRAEHPGVDLFEGVLIRWGGFSPLSKREITDER